MTQSSNILHIGGPSSGKTARTVDSLFDYVRSHPTARICIVSRGRLSPFMNAAVGYVRMTYPGVTVTVQRCGDRKDGVQGVPYQYVTDWPYDSA